jgi:inner membrane protein
MPTVMTHAVVGVGLGMMFTSRKMPALYWVVAAGLPMLADLDVIAFRLGIPYQSEWGHRGFTHSLSFAFAGACLTAAVTWQRFGAPLLDLLGFYFAVLASHGLLDAFTNGGLGVAFFWPLDQTRYFFPWRPIQVSPIGTAFFSRDGIRTMETEVVWVWLPTALLVGLWCLVRRLWVRGQKAPPSPPFNP